MVALPLGAGSLVRPELGLAAMLSLVGLGFTVVYVIVQEGRWPLWAAAGAGVAAFLAVAVASAGYLSDSGTPGSNRMLLVQEATAGLAAAQLFLLFYATAFTFAAAGGATVS
jgi:hypothetical protein